MSMTDAGKVECDKCGGDCGNGSVLTAVVVSDLDPDNPGMVRNLHFCRENGCNKKVLNATHLAHYKEKHDG